MKLISPELRGFHLPSPYPIGFSSQVEPQALESPDINGNSYDNKVTSIKQFIGSHKYYNLNQPIM